VKYYCTVSRAGACNCLIPFRNEGLATIVGNSGFPAAFGLPEAFQFGFSGEKSGGDSGQVGRSQSCCFRIRGPHNGAPEQVGLKLHEEIVHGGAAVDPQFLKGLAGIGLHGGNQIAGLEGDTLEGGADDVSFSGSSGQAADQAARVGIPMRRAESDESGDDVDAAVVRKRFGDLFRFRRGSDDAELIAQPLYGGSRDEYAAFHGERSRSGERRGAGGKQAIFRVRRVAAGMQQGETSCPVGILAQPRAEARLTRQGCLLIARDSRNRNGRAEDRWVGLSHHAARWNDFGQHGTRDLEDAEHVGVPIARFQIHQHGARGVGDVGDMAAAAGKVPNEPGIDVAEKQLTISGALGSIGNVIEQPANFAGGKISVDHQTGAFFNQLRVGGITQRRAIFRCAPALPNDGGSDGMTGSLFPDDNGFALIGDAKGGEVLRHRPGQRHGFPGGFDLQVPDLLGVLFHPAGMRVGTVEGAPGDGDAAARLVIDGGARARRPFIKRKHEWHAAIIMTVMLFHRNRPKKLKFEDYVQRAREAGFQTTALSAGKVRVERNGIAAMVQDGGEAPKVTERAGILMGDEIASLVDGGFQKFLQTPSGKRQPALAWHLKAIHEFQEDLREALGLVSLYNEGLGSVSNLYLYDRVEDRDSDRPKKPWELKVR
jgi:hypothetical protein